LTFHDDYKRWLTGIHDDVLALQRPYPADRMTVRRYVFPMRQASAFR